MNEAYDGLRTLVIAERIMDDRSMNLIDVGIPLPVDNLFTYRVPDGLRDRVEVGRRVLVPFRNKIRAGFVAGFSDPAHVKEELKEVNDIPEEQPYLTPTLWKFLSWLAEYYLLPIGLVLRTALPPG